MKNKPAVTILKRTAARSFLICSITVIISLPHLHSPPLLVRAAEGFLKKIRDYQNSFLFSSFNHLLTNHLPPPLVNPRHPYSCEAFYRKGEAYFSLFNDDISAY
jgi:hypothetical protein